ncbi:hypothetical protein ALC57_18652 [Trachymyrmex cornetzi]|uniref:Uncharacterized protein n=1 Tax=Trachymyrmex cornetzi TaxID=471704 RepID=A0A195D8M9_9HYME|nr:hypothetical protein ALC57_18652 [Trachymyrmex cornetzi]
MVHVFPRVTWRSHVCASHSFERPPVAGPSTATLDWPRTARRSWRANEPDVSSAFLHGRCGFFLDGHHPRRALRRLAELKGERNKVRNEFTGLASEFQKYKGPLTMGVAGKKAERAERSRE